jgi:hypothetical protein
MSTTGSVLIPALSNEWRLGAIIETLQRCIRGSRPVWHLVKG